MEVEIKLQRFENVCPDLPGVGDVHPGESEAMIGAGVTRVAAAAAMTADDGPAG